MRILIVEDESTLREQLEKHLERAGYAVDSAADGEEGLYFGREHQYDAAIVDLKMPGVDGWGLVYEGERLGY